MTSKQRANLRAMASKLDPIFQIGKEGLSQNSYDGIAEALEKRELIKITVLKTCDESAKEAGELLSQRLKAQLVATIGSKIILYKKSSVKDFKHLEF